MLKKYNIQNKLFKHLKNRLVQITFYLEYSYNYFVFRTWGFGDFNPKFHQFNIFFQGTNSGTKN